MARIDIEELFRQHKLDEDQLDRVQSINEAARMFADHISDNTPESPEQTLAIRAVKDASMQAILSICMNEATN